MELCATLHRVEFYPSEVTDFPVPVKFEDSLLLVIPASEVGLESIALENVDAVAARTNRVLDSVIEIRNENGVDFIKYSRNTSQRGSCNLRVFTLDFLSTLVADDLDGVEDGASGGGLIQVLEVVALNQQPNVLGVVLERHRTVKYLLLERQKKLSTIPFELCGFDHFDGPGFSVFFEKISLRVLLALEQVLLAEELQEELVVPVYIEGQR